MSGVDGVAAAAAKVAQFDGTWSQLRATGTTTNDDSFAATLAGAVSRVSEAQDVASSYATAFARGENVELHQVMAASEEAGIALEMLVELRNKVLDAYHTLVSMQS
jgi:flagellar hook-basal body complex protein FliE